MSSSTKNLDPAFQGVGQKIGLEIWRIENFQPVPLPKSDYAKFYSGDSYIILKTACGKAGSFIHDIHFWIGKDSTQDEYTTAAIKSVELDASIGGKTIINREIQFYESDKFLSYFKPCIIPLNGGFVSGFKKEEEKIEFENRLYVCRGKRVVRIKQVPFARSSLNHDDVFILDTELKIYQFNGANSNIQDRAKALEVVQFLKDNYHNGHNCDIAIVDDGKLVPEFWAFFGGFAPIGKKIILEDEIFPQITPPKLYSIEDGELKLLEGVICKETLENNKCYLLDCGAQIFIWVGKITQLDERRSAIKAAEEFIMKENRPKGTQIMQINQGYEPISFKSKFENWTAVTSTGTSSAEQGKGIVAALLKQQGLNAKGATKGQNANEQIPPLLQGGGKLEVWRINGSAKTPVSKGEIGKFYSGDCYIILYTYYFKEKKEEYFLSCWMGKDSVQDDQIMTTRLANTMWGSLKGRPIQGLIYQGNEPPQFIALFEPMITLKGGISTGYKKFISENNINDETYNSDKIALIQISGTSIYNNNSVQVNPSAESLCSSDCFLLQSGKNSVFLWQGNSSTFEQQKLATKIAEFLKPGVNIKNIKEGNESSLFWSSIGGKNIFNGKQINNELIRDPHLYSFSQNKGKLEVAEIYNFCQDDLLTEDILILDTNAEVFIWIGNSVDSKDRQKAFEIGQQYIEMQLLEKNLTKNIPIYKVTEGNEPSFFTNYFSWDHTKAMPQGNSFEKKLAHIFGSALNLSEASEKRKKATNGREATQRAAALAALSSAFSPPPDAKISSPKSQSQSSQRSTAMAALNTVLTGEQKSQPSTRGSSPVTPITEQKSPSAVSKIENLSPMSKAKETDSPVVETTGDEPKREKITTGEEPNREKTTNEEGKSIFSYEQLKSKSSNPVSGIDYKQREAYLSELEFETVFGMSKEKFYFQPKWKQEMQKKKVDLF